MGFSVENQAQSKTPTFLRSLWSIQGRCKACAWCLLNVSHVISASKYLRSGGGLRERTWRVRWSTRVNERLHVLHWKRRSFSSESGLACGCGASIMQVHVRETRSGDI